MDHMELERVEWLTSLTRIPLLRNGALYIHIHITVMVLSDIFSDHPKIRSPYTCKYMCERARLGERRAFLLHTPVVHDEK